MSISIVYIYTQQRLIQKDDRREGKRALLLVSLRNFRVSTKK